MKRYSKISKSAFRKEVLVRVRPGASIQSIKPLLASHATCLASAESLPVGRVTVGYDFVYDGGKPGSGGTGAISINGRKVASGRIERTIPFLFGMETADVGIDLCTPVTKDYDRRKNKFTGRINKISIELKKMTAADEATEKKAAGESNDVEENLD